MITILHLFWWCVGAYPTPFSVWVHLEMALYAHISCPSISHALLRPWFSWADQGSDIHSGIPNRGQAVPPPPAEMMWWALCKPHQEHTPVLLIVSVDAVYNQSTSSVVPPYESWGDKASCKGQGVQSPGWWRMPMSCIFFSYCFSKSFPLQAWVSSSSLSSCAPVPPTSCWALCFQCMIPKGCALFEVSWVNSLKIGLVLVSTRVLITLEESHSSCSYLMGSRWFCLPPIAMRKLDAVSMLHLDQMRKCLCYHRIAGVGRDLRRPLSPTSC